MRQIRLARTHDKAQISTLRVAEFSRSKDFRLLKPDLLHWCEMDEIHPVLGIWDGDAGVVGTLRLIRVDTPDRASEVLEAELDEALRFPGLVFACAATRRSHQCRGLNQLLRYHAILAAREHGIQTLMSPIYQSAPRIAFMEDLGYVCRVMEKTWQTKLAPNSPRVLAFLERSKFDKALGTLEQRINDLIESYPWAGPPLTF